MAETSRGRVTITLGRSGQVCNSLNLFTSNLVYVACFVEISIKCWHFLVKFWEFS